LDTGSGSGWKTRIIFIRAQKLFFGVKILKFFDADPGSRILDGKKIGPRIQDLGSRMEKFGSGIRDKHPGSAKVEISSPNLLGLKEPNDKGILG
jgi:hypothetical protein